MTITLPVTNIGAGGGLAILVDTSTWTYRWEGSADHTPGAAPTGDNQGPITDPEQHEMNFDDEKETQV